MKDIKTTFARRLSRRIIIPMLVTMIVISFLVFIFATAGMTAMYNDHFANSLEITNEKVTTMMKSVEVSAANIVDEVEYYVSRPEDVFTALESELELNRRLTGCGVGFIPDYYPKMGRWFEPYARFDSLGRVESLQIGGEDHDYFSAEWYNNGFASKEDGNWSNPYYDDKGAMAMLCSYSIPVCNKDREIIGIFCADISLEWLSDQVKEMDAKENERNTFMTTEDGETSYSFILAHDGRYIVHPDKSRILERSIYDFADSSSADYLKLAKEMIDGNGGTIRADVDSVDSYVFYAPLRTTGWSMAIVVPAAIVMLPGMVVGGIIIFLIIIGLVIVFFLSYYNVRKASRPLKNLAESADAVAHGNFDTPLPTIKYKDEIYVLRNSFDNMQRSLTNYIDKLTETTAQNASMEKELGIAREIQMSMLPKVYPAFPDRKDVDVFGQLTPAKAVGGDLYDFFIRDEHLFFCIGDVSGKGVPASLVMSATSTQFRTLSSNESSPEQIVKRINDHFTSRNESLMFVTLFVGVLNLGTGVLKYCNAGHDAPALVSKSKVNFLNVASNIAIGVMPDFKYTCQQLTMPEGSCLFLYTDGLTEAENASEELFGEERTLEALKAADKSTPAKLIESVTGAVGEFVGGAEQSDDITMLAITFKP